MKLKLSREFKIGFFGIAMIACLYWGVNFLKGTDIFNSSDSYYAVYDQVNGLQPSASVVIKGLKVGKVSSMSYDPQKSDNIVIEFAVKSKYKIPKNTKARIFSDGIMSGKAIELELGNSDQYLQSGDTLFSEVNKGLLEVAGSEIEFLKQRANDLINKVMETLTNVNNLLVNNQENLHATLSNVASLTDNLNKATAKSLPEILNNVNELTRSLNAKTSQIDHIVSNVESFTDSLSQAQIPSLVAQMSTTLGQLNATLSGINHGEGTVGQLLNDKALYDSLVTASSNLSALLADIKQNPKRYINVSVFGGRNRD